MGDDDDDDDDDATAADDVPEAVKTAISCLKLSTFSHAIALQFLRRCGSGNLPRVLAWLTELSSANSKGFTSSALSPPSKWQRGCPEIIPGLRSVPVWRDETGDPFVSAILSKLRASYPALKKELLSLRGAAGFQEYMSPRWDSASSTSGDSNSSSSSSSSSGSGGGASSVTMLHGVRGTSAGLWSIYYLHLHNSSYEGNLARCPLTKALLDSLSKYRMYGHAMFSALAPNTHVATHTGPTNKKLRFHLPLIVPAPLPPPPLPPSTTTTVESDAAATSVYETGSTAPSAITSTTTTPGAAVMATGGGKGSISCTLRVGSEVIPVVEGEPFAFDDSFQHEAWNNSSASPRLVLIFDVWHPDLTDAEVKFLQFVRAGNLRVAQSVKGHVEEKNDFYAVLEQAKALPVTDEHVFGCEETSVKDSALLMLQPLAAPPVKDD